MAFDLHVSGFASGKAGARARGKLQTLVDKSGGEAWGQRSDSFGVGIGRLGDKQAARFFASLVKLAAREGLTIHDPQAGEDVDLDAPSPLPPGWAPPEPMDAEGFARAVQAYGRKHLQARGYSAFPWGAQRSTDEGHLLQRLTFRATKDLFCVLVDWRFFFDGEEDTSWPAPIEICDYIAGTALESEWPAALKAPRWGKLSAAKSDLPASLALIERALTELVHPLLDSIDTVESLVAAFEDGRLGQVARQTKEHGRPYREAFYMAFGYSPIGAARNMALSYRRVGRREDGARLYRACLAELGDPASLMSGDDKLRLAEAQALFG